MTNNLAMNDPEELKSNLDSCHQIDDIIAKSFIYEDNENNRTLMTVIRDNEKTMERRILPLLEMFGHECYYFKGLQSQC